MLPTFVVHADWSSDSKKRWICTATLVGNVYRISRPARVADPSTLVRWAIDHATGSRALLGFDFPIGLPNKYAALAGVDRFLNALPNFGSKQWSEFFNLAETPAQISTHRPFYPRRPGGTSQRFLVEGLHVSTMDDLLRKCDVGNGDRNKACCLFWTLGGNQVGRAAISGWREVLLPALRDLRGEVSVWPYDGDLKDLLPQRAATIVETYPAEACLQLGLGAPGRGWSKRNQRDRVKKRDRLRQYGQRLGANLSDVDAAIDDGFGTTSTGEDQFDALVGLLGMLSVIRDIRSDGVPLDPIVRATEGWIFGQASAPSAALV